MNWSKIFNFKTILVALIALILWIIISRLTAKPTSSPATTIEVANLSEPSAIDDEVVQYQTEIFNSNDPISGGQINEYLISIVDSYFQTIANLNRENDLSLYANGEAVTFANQLINNLLIDGVSAEYILYDYEGFEINNLTAKRAIEFLVIEKTNQETSCYLDRYEVSLAADSNDYNIWQITNIRVLEQQPSSCPDYLVN